MSKCSYSGLPPVGWHVEGTFNDLCFFGLVTYNNIDFSSDCCELTWHVGQAQVFSCSRRKHPRGHFPNHPLLVGYSVAMAWDAALDHFKSDLQRCGPFEPLFQQRIPPEKVFF